MPDPKKPSKPLARKPATRSATTSRSRSKPPTPPLNDDADLPSDELDDLDSAGPVAVGRSSGLGARLAMNEDDEPFNEDDSGDSFEEQLFNLGQEPEPEPDADASPPAVEEGPPVIERPRDELIAGGLALVLAASTFLPWFKAGIATFSGWAGGRFGPAVTFLALAAVAIVALRKLGKPVVFPLDHALVIEGIGWICTLAILASNLMPPKIGLIPTQRNSMLFVSLVLAVGLALFAGRISSGAPFVMRPGWFKSAAGKLGAAILIVAIAAGTAFGVMNGGETPLASAGQGGKTPTLIKGLPDCVKKYKFPIPEGFKPVNGYADETTGSCIATLSTRLSVSDAYAKYQAALKAANWTFAKAKATKGQRFRSLTLKSPRCGFVTIAGVGKVEQMYVQLQDCAALNPGRN